MASDSKVNMTLDQIINMERKKGTPADNVRQTQRYRGRGRGSRPLGIGRGGRGRVFIGRARGGVRGIGAVRPGLKTGGAYRGVNYGRRGRRMGYPVVTSANVRMAQKILLAARRRQSLVGVGRGRFRSFPQRGIGSFASTRLRQSQRGARWRRGGAMGNRGQNLFGSRVRLDRNFDSRQSRRNQFDRVRPFRELESKRKNFGVMRSDLISNGSRQQINRLPTNRQRGRGRNFSQSASNYQQFNDRRGNGGQLMKININNRLSYGGSRDSFDDDFPRRKRNNNSPKKQNLSLNDRFTDNVPRTARWGGRSRGGRGRGNRGGDTERRVFF